MSCSYCVTAAAVGASEACPCDERDEDTLPSCEECGGVLGYSGTLGNLNHFECRNCGARYSGVAA